MAATIVVYDAFVIVDSFFLLILLTFHEPVL